MRILVLLALALSVTTALAQPDAARKTIVRPPPAQQIDSVARELVEDVNQSRMNSAQLKISGARQGFFGANVWLDEFIATFPFDLELQSVSVPQITGENATVNVNYRLKLKAERNGVAQPAEVTKALLAPERSETLQLKLSPLFYDPARKTWQIVVPDVEPTEPRMESRDAKLLAYFAFKIAQKPVSDKNLSSERSLSNLKQLVFALAQFTQDFDDQFAFAPEHMQVALKAYLKNLSPFYVPGSYEAYAFNANLSERLVASLIPNEGVEIMTRENPRFIKNGKQTVMLYEGRNEKPIFRYDVKAAIAFADGRVALVSPEEAKSLIWNP